MDIVQMLEIFKDPNTIHTLSTGDKLGMSMVVTLLGMSITFVALVLLWCCISLMSKVLLSKSNDEKPVAKPKPVKAAAAVEAVEANNDEDEELIAVISAAVAASLNTSIHNIIVRNVVQVSDNTPAWGRVGRSEQMNTRF